MSEKNDSLAGHKRRPRIFPLYMAGCAGFWLSMGTHAMDRRDWAFGWFSVALAILGAWYAYEQARGSAPGQGERGVG